MYLLLVLKNLMICQLLYIVSFCTAVCIVTNSSGYSHMKNFFFIFLNTSLSTFPMVRQIAQQPPINLGGIRKWVVSCTDEMPLYETDLF